MLLQVYWSRHSHTHPTEPKICVAIFWNGQIHVHFELARCDFGDYQHDDISHAVTLSENRPLAGMKGGSIKPLILADSRGVRHVYPGRMCQSALIELILAPLKSWEISASKL